MSVRPLIRATKIALAACAVATVLTIATRARADGSDFNLIVRPPVGASTWFAPPVAARGDVKAVVLATARRFGVPEHVADYHARRESGYRAAARNPKSTAKGVLQVIHGTHEAIVGRRMSLTEHLALMSDARHGAAVGMAHIAACMEARPDWTPGKLWRSGHVAGLRSCGTSLNRAAQIYAQRG